MDNLSRAGKRLMGFCRTNLFKRLESSGFAFLLSISRHILRNYIYVYAIENQLPLPIGAQEANLLDEFLDDVDWEDEDEIKDLTLLLKDKEYYEKAEKVYRFYDQHSEHKFDWIRAQFFKKSLKQSLISDSKELLKILSLAKTWEAKADKQLAALVALCTKKHKDEKVLVFTQFADTARYLAAQLRAEKIARVECVTGDAEDPTEYAYRFSPESNDKKDLKGTEKEIRILISTDVLSEGQNLQDAHIVVNYDLPWALIRLIQRAGRVDRIGQKAETIVCYSFLPEDGLETLISLRGRLKKRIQQNAEVVGSDETFFEGDPINLRDLYNEKAGILDDADDGEVDLASYAFQVWKNACDKDPELKKTIPELPNVVYATKPHTAGTKETEGVIVYTRTADDNDVLAWVNHRGEIITQSQLTILKAAECMPDGAALSKLEDHHKLVQSAMQQIRDVESSIGGQLGKKSGAKFRTYMRLSRYYEENKGGLFATEELKRAIDELYKFPLREFARETLNRQLKAGLSDPDLADLVVALRDEDKLCIVDNSEADLREPQIICSLGLKVQ